MKVYRIACQGFALRDQLILRSMLRIVAAACNHRWVFSDEEMACEVVVTGPLSGKGDVPPTTTEGAIRVVACPLGGPGTTTGSHLPFPLRANQFAELLNGLAKELDQRADPAPERRAKAGALLPIRDLITLLRSINPSLASEFGAIVIRKAVAIRFHGTESKVLWSLGGGIPLHEVLESIQKGAPIAHVVDVRGLTTRPSVGRPLPELIWALASIDPDHQPLFSRLPRARFQFESWPPIDPGASSAIQLRIAAALVRRSLSWTDLLSIPGATPQDAIRVLNAGLHCSLLRTTIETRGEERGEAARAMAVSVQNPQRDPAKRRMWLVEMLRSAIRVELP